MSRLIDADALIADMEKCYCKDCERRKGVKGGKVRMLYDIGEAPCRACGTMDAMDEIEEAPTIEAEPVRHGHWEGWTTTHWTKKYDDNGDPIYKEHTYYQCSECRRRTIIKSAYCPACGAKMDEVSE